MNSNAVKVALILCGTLICLCVLGCLGLVLIAKVAPPVAPIPASSVTP